MTQATVAAPAAGTRTAHRVTRWIIGIVGGLLIAGLIGLVAVYLWMSYVPVDLDLATTRRSEQGLYQIGYSSELGTVPVNQMHRWTLHVETADGRPVEQATITVDGDMPQHGHGLPTRPQVTRYLGNGDYLVEGLKFHMSGWWVMEFTITAQDQTDQVRFNLLLK